MDRPILRFADSSPSTRLTGSPRSQPSPPTQGRPAQRRRFQAAFDRLERALQEPNPEFVLRQDPSGIAPERALVFVTASRIQNFARAAQEIGLRVYAEFDIPESEEFPDDSSRRTLYATMPTTDSFLRLLSLWRAYQDDQSPPTGAAPVWRLFDLLLELRPWGPEDRLSGGARTVLEDRLSVNETDDVSIEFEIWPDTDETKRLNWRRDTQREILQAGGTILDQSSITEEGFVYEAILARLPVLEVRKMLDSSGGLEGLVTLEGVQFILPHAIGQAEPGEAYSAGSGREYEQNSQFSPLAPIRGALLDGTPVVGHLALQEGVVVEDVHDLVPRSIVSQRYHATAMASLILRGDLDSDGVSLSDSRIVSVPLLVDSANGSWSPDDRLFVDLVHTALTNLLKPDNPLAGC